MQVFSPMKTVALILRYGSFERVQGLSNEAESVSHGFTWVRMKPGIGISYLHGINPVEAVQMSACIPQSMQTKERRQDPHHVPSKEDLKFPNEVSQPRLRAKHRDEGTNVATRLDVGQNALIELIRDLLPLCVLRSVGDFRRSIGPRRGWSNNRVKARSVRYLVLYSSSI